MLRRLAALYPGVRQLFIEVGTMGGLDNALFLDRMHPFTLRSAPSLASTRPPLFARPDALLRQHCTTPASRFSTRAAARVGESEDPSAASAATPHSLEATAAALDPERTTASLGYTWLTHWQLVEEDRQFRRMALQSVRGRQAARQQQLMEMLDLPAPTPIAGDPAPAESDAEVRIVHGRLSVLPAEDTSAEEEAMDDLTWIASHPEAAELELELGDGAGAAQAMGWPLPGDDAVLPGAVQLRLGSEEAAVRPLWIAVHQEESSGQARLFESVVPLQAEVVDRLSTDLSPMCTVSGLSFGSLADLRHGSWSNFFVGLVGGVAIDEADVLWPNQVLHRDRVLYNVRDVGDVARFLADPRKQDVEAHAANLRRLAEERGYRPGWCWYMLRSRWGLHALKELGVKPSKV